MQTESVQKTYKKVTQLEHVLLRPDTYVGSTSLVEDNMWVLEDEKIVQKKIRYVPGLYKIFDQILVNAADNKQRDRRMSKIEVKISEKGVITVINDGKSIPIQIHKEHKIYVSELIFGHLLTSSNYQDATKKVTGGRNGYGAKLANIFSQYFQVQTGDSTQRKLLTIQWSKNMTIMEGPKIVAFQGKDYTKIQFKPDFKKFGLGKGLTEDILGLFKKRVYDLAGILKGVKVYLNDKLINIRNFQDYVSMYSSDQSTPLIWDPNADQDSGRWNVVITPSDGQFHQVSFVNGICTTKGGSHVNHVTDQIVEQLSVILNKKAKDMQIKPFQIKSHLKIFINCLIENPAFDSQTKDTLTTKQDTFGSNYTVSQKVVKQICKSGITDRILALVRAKQNNKIDRQLKKIKNNRPLIPKLEDANQAGKSDDCILILTEGDSAKTLAMSGIEHLNRGRDKYGVFPLRGKPLNVRDMTQKQVMENAQLSSIVKIMGLNFGKVYQNTISLRYSAVMIMADQDNDGTHIKGLIINFFQYFWPSLCMIPGFLKEFNTPIIRCSKDLHKIDFFNERDYKAWKETAQSGWRIKYYKGLGTSTSAEAKQYFSNVDRHLIQFNYDGDSDKKAIDLVFNKKNADMRKRWLQQSTINSISVDYSKKLLSIEEFINLQYIHFSHTDNFRSIPSIVDGLKPSQRKVLFGCFKRNLRNQIKVAQLAGYISEHSAYHHGQQSLCGTIINMAQSYIGSNNINLLQPIGQFGTRYLLGKDAASPRYIFTSLNPLTRYLFKQQDDHIAQYIQEQDQLIEPICYYPILPLILINGSSGIGTGWSTTVHPHKVDDVIGLVRRRLKGEYKGISLGWEGFTGAVQLEKKAVYSVRGSFLYDGETVTISEIPINKSITDYKQFLQQMCRTIENPDPDIQDIRQYHMGDRIEFQVKFVQGKQPAEENLENFLKLRTTLQTTNMTLFDSSRKIKRYEEVSDILQQFYDIRLKAYKQRKEYLISRFKRQLQILETKINFIDRVVQSKFKMNGSKDEWIQQLIACKYPKFHQLTKVKSTKVSDYRENEDSNKDYNYLLSMPIWSFCKEKIQELRALRKEIQQILKYHERASELQMWEKDLNDFEAAWKQTQEKKEISGVKDSKKRVRYQLNRRSAIDHVNQLSNTNGNKKTKKSRNNQQEVEQFNDSLNRESSLLKNAANRFEPKGTAMGGYTASRVRSSKQSKEGSIIQPQDSISEIKASNKEDIPVMDQKSKNGRKRVKANQNLDESQKKSVLEEKCDEQHSQKQEDQEQKQEIKENHNTGNSVIDSLLSKYLKPGSDNENLSFQERIRARLSQSGNIFEGSVIVEKGQKKDEKDIEDDSKYDFLLD